MSRNGQETRKYNLRNPKIYSFYSIFRVFEKRVQKRLKEDAAAAEEAKEAESGTIVDLRPCVLHARVSANRCVAKCASTQIVPNDARSTSRL